MIKKEAIKIANNCVNCITKPCQVGCPLNNDIPLFIDFVKKISFMKLIISF